MIAAELLEFLQAFYQDTAALAAARQVRSRSVTAYDANNAYQQVINRQDVHLRWLSDAIGELSAVPREVAAGEGVSAGSQKPDLHQVIDADVRAQEGFIAKWAPRLPSVTNARHRKMLELIIGEMREHHRALKQALDGRTDVLGRHADGKELSGTVLPERPRN